MRTAFRFSIAVESAAGSKSSSRDQSPKIGSARRLGLEPDEMFESLRHRHLRAFQQKLSRQEGAVQDSPAKDLAHQPESLLQTHGKLAGCI
jgi:hypothetical protein